MGVNLLIHLNERTSLEISTFVRGNSVEYFSKMVEEADFIFHFAGVNRPETDSQFQLDNADLTQTLCNALLRKKNKAGVLYTSSTQALLDNAYGTSKKKSEEALQELHNKNGNPVYIFRLPNVFGKGAKPNYNSVVATFCHNIVRSKLISIHDKETIITLAYIDDVIAKMINCMDGDVAADRFITVNPEYQITLGKLAEQLKAFHKSRLSLITEDVGTGITRALYATYLSYILPIDFSYKLKTHTDPRGVFTEVLKTKNSGQFSFFTMNPGVTRGGHYHHTKSEKFIVIQGEARFCFKNIISGEQYSLTTSEGTPEIVETIPGWSHNITNIGNGKASVLLWANEIFDQDFPDTYISELDFGE